MALTLLDVARSKKDNFEGGVVETFAMEADFFKRVPLQTINTTEIRSRRHNSLPTVGFRKRGEAYGSIQGGAWDDTADATYAMGGMVDIDITDLRDKSLPENPLTERVQHGVRGMAWKANETLINGDHGVDEDEFEGVKVRIANLPAAQTVYATDASNDLDLAGAIAANTTATMQTFLDKLDEAVYACDGHSADVCLTNADGIKAIKQVLRRLNLTKDMVEVTDPVAMGSNMRRTSATKANAAVWHYNGVDYIDMGLDHDQTDPIVGTDTIGGVATRPFYFLKLGNPYLTAIQQYAMRVSKPIELEDGVTVRVVIDWPAGLRNVHPKFGVVLKGTKVV